MNRRLALVTLAGIAIVAPQAAQAHLVVTGMGPVYDGITHFSLSPEDVLPVIVLGLFAGLRGTRPARLSLAALVSAWAMGGVVAMAGLMLPPVALAITTAALFLLVGGLLAANLQLSAEISAAMAGVLGLLRGIAGLSGVSLNAAHVVILLGMCAGVFVAFAISASLTLPLKRAWMIVAARVSGSWLAASGLLLLGWIIRYGAVAG